MKKLLLSLLTVTLFFSCVTNNTNSSTPSAEDTAIFNKHVESWKLAASGFTAEDPEQVMSIFADSLTWNNPEALMNVSKTKEDLTNAVNFYIGNFENITFTDDV